MHQLKKYVIALTNLYGLVHKDTVIDIYNQHNEDHIEPGHIQQLLQHEERKLFNQEHIGTHQDYLVKRKIIERGNFEQELGFRKPLPSYIPGEEEINCYGESPYVEPTDELGYLVNFLSKKYWYSYRKCAKQAHDILLFCRSAREFEGINEHLKNSPLKFKDNDEMLELAELIINLAYNTRVQEFNGFKLKELQDENGELPETLKKAIMKEFPVFAVMLGIMSKVYYFLE